MSQALYDIYEKSVFDLVSTMVIKSSAVADALNKTLIKNKWPNPGSDKTTWRYYMNMAGEYHPYDEKALQDSPIPGRMVIKVAGTDGPVDAAFTKELLQNDSVIANEYAYGTAFYNALVAKYPIQVDLINGILNPVDKTTAIAATEGEILYAGGWFKTLVVDTEQGIARKLFVARVLPGRKPPNYIEEGEDNLLPLLERYIQDYMFRWNNPDYAQTNDLYTASQLAILYMNLPMQIMNIRLDNCFTPYVHTYHIREYLESNGKLIQYVDSIPTEQLRWLYRNLRWLEKNIGKTSTFELLIDKLITPLNMPLLGYDIKHNLANQDTISPAQDLPDITMTRYPLSKGGIMLGDANRTVQTIMTNEIGFARDNTWNADQIASDLVEQMQTRSRFSRLPTKVLESSLTDESQNVAYPLARTLWDLWVYLASRDEYVASVYITHPITGQRSLLSPKQCLIIYLWLVTRDQESPPSVIPGMFANTVPRPTNSTDPLVPRKPTLTEFLTTAGKLLPTGVPTDLYGTMLDMSHPKTVDDFYSLALAVNDEQMRRYRTYVKLEDFSQRALADSMVETLYFRAECHPVPSGTTFAAWFEQNGIDLSALTVAQRSAFETAIVIAVTGVSADTTNKRLHELQQAIVAAMRYLSSYAVQYLSEITGSLSYPGPWGPLRLGGITSYSDVDLKAEFPKFTVVGGSVHSDSTDGIDLRGEDTPPEITITEESFDQASLGLYFNDVSVSNTTYNLQLTRFTITDIVDNNNPLAVVAPDNVLSGFQYP